MEFGESFAVDFDQSYFLWNMNKKWSNTVLSKSAAIMSALFIDMTYAICHFTYIFLHISGSINVIHYLTLNEA